MIKMISRKLLKRRTLMRMFLLSMIAYLLYLCVCTYTNSFSSDFNSNVLDAPTRLKRTKNNLNLYANLSNWNILAQIEHNGEFGKAMRVDEKLLEGELKKEYDEGWNKYAFNEYSSKRIPFNRTLPDIRLPG